MNKVCATLVKVETDDATGGANTANETSYKYTESFLYETKNKGPEYNSGATKTECNVVLLQRRIAQRHIAE